MKPSRALAMVTVAGSTVTSMLLPGTAFATPQVGTCTSSYTLYNEQDLEVIDPAVAGIFGVIDTNHDLLICFKPYPNGDHGEHAGNLVDDKAGPKS